MCRILRRTKMTNSLVDAARPAYAAISYMACAGVLFLVFSRCLRHKNAISFKAAG